jgi:ABC-type amino acid transport substrate-binding protein
VCVCGVCSAALGFSYDIVDPADGLYGVTKEDGSYSGIMGDFMAKDVDLIYSGLAVTSERAKIIHFTQPFYQSGEARGRTGLRRLRAD